MLNFVSIVSNVCDKMMKKLPTNHHMGRRSHVNDYRLPGIYHVTISLDDRQSQLLGIIVGQLDKADGDFSRGDNIF